jgi:hypothetical protein
LSYLAAAISFKWFELLKKKTFVEVQASVYQYSSRICEDESHEFESVSQAARYSFSMHRLGGCLSRRRTRDWKTAAHSLDGVNPLGYLIPAVELDKSGLLNPSLGPAMAKISAEVARPQSQHSTSKAAILD